MRVLGLSDEQIAIIRENLPEVGIVEMPGGEAEDSGPYKTHAFLIVVSSAIYSIVRFEDLMGGGPTPVASRADIVLGTITTLTILEITLRIAIVVSPVRPSVGWITIKKRLRRIATSNDAEGIGTLNLNIL